MGAGFEILSELVPKLGAMANRTVRESLHGPDLSTLYVNWGQTQNFLANWFPNPAPVLQGRVAGPDRAEGLLYVQESGLLACTCKESSAR